MPLLSVQVRDDPFVSAPLAYVLIHYYDKTPPTLGGVVLFLLGLCLSIIVIWVLMTWKK